MSSLFYLIRKYQHRLYTYTDNSKKRQCVEVPIIRKAYSTSVRLYSVINLKLSNFFRMDVHPPQEMLPQGKRIKSMKSLLLGSRPVGVVATDKKVSRTCRSYSNSSPRAGDTECTVTTKL